MHCIFPALDVVGVGMSDGLIEVLFFGCVKVVFVFMGFGDGGV